MAVWRLIERMDWDVGGLEEKGRNLCQHTPEDKTHSLWRPWLTFEKPGSLDGTVHLAEDF